MPTQLVADRYVRENVKRLIEDRNWSVRELARRVETLASDLEGGGPSHGRLSDLLNNRRGAITWTEIQLLARALRTSVFAVVLPPEDDPDFRHHLAWRWFWMPPETLAEQSLKANQDRRQLFYRVVQYHPYYIETAKAQQVMLKLWTRGPQYDSTPGYQQAWKMLSETQTATFAEIQRRIDGGEIPGLEELFSDLLWDRDAARVDPANYGDEWRTKVRARWLETDLGWMKGEQDVG